MRPGWRTPSGSPTTWTYGLLAGAAYGLLPLVAEMGGEYAIVLWAPAALACVVAPFVALAHLGRTRRSANWRLTAAIAAPSLVFLALVVAPWVSSLTPLHGDVIQLFLPVVACLLAADRFAARGAARWRERALAALSGYLATWAFFFAMPRLPGALVAMLAWLPLLALLAVRLPRSARIVLVALAALPSLSLGGFTDSTWTARTVEWLAFLGYAGLSLLAWRRDRGTQPPAPAAPAAHA